MAVIAPFRALRPTPSSTPAVAAVPYDVVSKEARALAAGNPLSVLRVSRAEIDLPQDTNPWADVVSAKAVENFEALKTRAARSRGPSEPLSSRGLRRSDRLT